MTRWQIMESFKTYGKNLPLYHTVVFGGVGQGPQVRQLQRGVDILVATPGRLMDLMEQGYVKLNQVEMFVLDEADRMMDMGFITYDRRGRRYIPDEEYQMSYGILAAVWHMRDRMHESISVGLAMADMIEHVSPLVANFSFQE